VTEDESTSGCKQGREVCIVEHLLCERFGSIVDVLFPVRWVGEDQVKLLASLSQLAKRREGILHAESRLAKRLAKRLKVLLHHLYVFC
jgi:hypothetical protein